MVFRKPLTVCCVYQKKLNDSVKAEAKYNLTFQYIDNVKS